MTTGTAMNTFELLAVLLAYPTAAYLAAVDLCAAGQVDSDPEIKAQLHAFAQALAGRELSDLEELYVQTFDMNPERALELGWHRFGETYERGSFLVEMRGLLRQYGVAENTELPDHLAHVMRLLDRMEPAAAQAFARTHLIAGLAKLRAGFKDEKQAYFPVIAALERAVQLAYGETKGA